ncbi:MAG: MlaD family protein [Desulfovibrio sp.]|nr:MlaD family protein [Desulfovibrio sp.]
MEIRANYILVGLFTLLVLFGGLGFTLWMAKNDKDIPTARYDIFCNESVLGLSVNSDVLFSGLRVGKVEEITISDAIPGAIRVRIVIAANTPVREDSRAEITMVGLTGVSAISISGGTAGSPLMKVSEDAVREIFYEPSPLRSVMTQMPDVLASANQLLNRMETMFSDRNAQSLTALLDSLAIVSKTVADRAEELDKLLLSAAKAAVDIEKLAYNANNTMASDITSISRSMNRIVKRVDSTLSVMEPGLKQFSRQGLADMQMLMIEMRNAIRVLTRIGQKVESDPRRFFFGEPVKEYENK